MEQRTHAALGIDIGGSGIKGAPVDVRSGELIAERVRIPTPAPSTPGAIGAVVRQLATQFEWTGPVGMTFPGVVRHGVVKLIANLDRSWEGTDAARILTDAAGLPTIVLNDADAAAAAEHRWGVGRQWSGAMLVVTLGTGIGTALVHDGHLVPNLELGHLILDGMDAEDRASARVRERDGLSWKEWAACVDEYLHYVDGLVNPDVIVIGGGVSRRHKKFFPYLTLDTPVVAAHLGNDAGIIGAALAASESTTVR